MVTGEKAQPHHEGIGPQDVVHNGIVENNLTLKNALIAKGHKFVSETDTEIIAHLIEDELNQAAAANTSKTASTSNKDCHSERSEEPPHFARTSTTSPEANTAEAVLTLPATNAHQPAI